MSTFANTFDSGFGARLQRAFAQYGRLCVGIDPHAFLLQEWGLENSAEGVREFGLRVVDAAAGRVGIVKPQVAFFERFGSSGYAALEQVLAAARAADLVVIADAKRGDLGSTLEAYGQAWLSVGSPLEADAMTLSPFQGVGAIAGALQLAVANGKGAFVLAATSNPEADAIQKALLAFGSRSVTRAIIDDVTQFNSLHIADTDVLAPIGIVLGATLDLSSYGIDLASPPSPALPVLAPGFGHQGAQLVDAAQIYGAFTPSVIVSESRSVLAAGPVGIADAITARAQEVQGTLG